MAIVCSPKGKFVLGVYGQKPVIKIWKCGYKWGERMEPTQRWFTHIVPKVFGEGFNARLHCAWEWQPLSPVFNYYAGIPARG